MLIESFLILVQILNKRYEEDVILSLTKKVLGKHLFDFVVLLVNVLLVVASH